MIAGVHHLAIATGDPIALAGFYESTLSLERRAEHRFDDGRVRSVWLSLGGGSLLMLELADAQSLANGREGPFSEKKPGLHLLALTIAASERESWIRRLKPLIESTTGFSIYFRDLDGNRIGLSHYPDVAPQAHVLE